MPLFDPSGDWAVVDSLETVTLFRRLTTSTFDAGASVPNSLRRAATKDEAILAGASLAGTALVWHLWAANFTGAAPKVNDVILDAAGVRWSVLKVGYETLTTRYQLTTIKER